MSKEHSPEVISKMYVSKNNVPCPLLLCLDVPTNIHFSFFINCSFIICSFIKKYYELLGSNPNDLYRFYKDDSSFTHTEGSQVLQRWPYYYYIIYAALYISVYIRVYVLCCDLPYNLPLSVLSSFLLPTP